MILTINPDKERTASAATLADLIALARSKPDQLAYGSAGLGNLTQLTFELLNNMAGVKMTHVPYRGTAASQLGLLSKEVDAAFDNPSAIPQMKAGRASPRAKRASRSVLLRPYPGKRVQLA